MRLLAYLQSLAWCIIPALGNVEKTIFLAPEAIHIPQQHPHLGDLKLEVLSPWNPTLRRQLPAAFTKSDLDKGKEAWFVLDGLTPQQRYEVRICWAATVGQHTSHPMVLPLSRFLSAEWRVQQPTAFVLDTYSLAAAFDTPELITSLAVYSESRQTSDSPESDPRLQVSKAEPSAILFLRVGAAADYYTTNETLMQNVPLVNVDISN
ncbi:hypothetical protein N7G274_005629 [Stereocaulon virgatum]|uniref:Uncharacterized protein n=1 Tax=Stereocaulon virgatum TaxID=373712 RepID=A0ABR4A8N5_9LECA